jgi:pimeloyl-ACP methyl ester carboxylesterase
VELRFIRLGEIEIAAWDWPGAGPPILFAHAAGFHARCWDQVVRALPGRRSVAVDLRGHGRSSKPAPPYPWRRFGEDLAGVADALGLAGAIGVGHSMGGHSMVSAACLRPAALAALLLIDPTIFPPERYGQKPFDASFVLKRRNRWASPQEMFERFRSRPPFVSWQPEVLRDYCQFGLLPDGDGFVLACPPPIETAIYSQSTAPDSNLYPEIPALEQPVTILRAGKPQGPEVSILSLSPTAPDLAAKFRRGRGLPLPDHDHYIPMADPELVAREISLLLAQL